MSYFIVTKEGVYRHEIKGLWRELKDAVSCAIKCSEEDIDGYHTYLVSSLEVDFSVEESEKVAEVVRRDSEYIRGEDGLPRFILFNPPHITVNYFEKGN